MSEVKAEPVSFCINGLSRFAFGDRWRFGVECEVQDCDVDPWGTLQPFGSFGCGLRAAPLATPTFQNSWSWVFPRYELLCARGSTS